MYVEDRTPSAKRTFFRVFSRESQIMFYRKMRFEYEQNLNYRVANFGRPIINHLMI